MGHTDDRQIYFSSRLAQVCGAVAVVLGISAISGWITGWSLLATLGTGRIPMAPSTASFFLLFGAAVFFHARMPQCRAARWMGIACGTSGTMLSLGLLILSSFHIHPQAEHLGIEISGTLGNVPMGHMSPLTALCFLFAGLSLTSLLFARAGKTWPAALSFITASAVVLIGLFLAVAYFLGNPLLYGSGVIPPALPTSIAFLALGTALALSSAGRVRPHDLPSHAVGLKATWALILIFVLSTAGIFTAGYLYFQNYQKCFRAEVKKTLAAIAEWKASELMHWRAERLGDAAVFFDNENFSELVRRSFDHPQDEEAQRWLRIWLEKVRAAYGYDRVFVLDPRGIEHAAAPDAADTTASHLVRDVSEVLSTGQIAFVDFHRDAPGRPIHLVLLVPIIDGAGHKPGVLALRIDPETHLYPLLRRWPTSSRTAETLLVRREGDDVLYLNELRHQKGTALNLRFLLDERNLPAAMAVRGETGVADGVDYRGVRVVAAVCAVPDSPWFLVARMDASEAYAPVREHLWMLAGIVGVLFAGAVAGVASLWRYRENSFYREQYEAAQALKMSEETLRTVFESARDGIVVADAETRRFVLVNEAMCRMTGYGRDELLSFAVPDIHPAQDVPRIVEEFGVQLRGEAALAKDIPVKRKDGSVFFSDVNSSPVHLGGRACVLGVFRDITDRKQAEEALAKTREQFYQSQKMEAVGRLAGGVAHDFNNMMSVVIGYCGLILADLDQGDPMRGNLEKIRSSGEKAAALTQQLLAFSRKQILAPKILDLNEVVRNMENMLRVLIGENIDIVVIEDKNLGTVKADPSQLEQVIMNLAVNSRDAMPEGGRLVMETAEVELDEDYAAQHESVIPGLYAMLAVTDTGCGMDQEIRSRLFEPFFTTKGVGKGTGLGLATVYGIVKQSGGHIWVYSEPGVGTTFKIYLPRVDEGETAVVPAKKSIRRSQGGEVILVVEDDPLLLELISEFLSIGGYSVKVAADGEKALAICRACPGEISLVVSDVIMPGMSGKLLADKIARIMPRVKVLFVSGYTDDMIAHHGVLAQGVPFLQKPYTMDGLLSAVRDLLDQGE